MPTRSVTLVILGASGDLTHRLLLPGLGTLLRAKPDYDIRLIGASSDDLTESEWRDRVRSALTEGGCRTERADAMAAASGCLRSTPSRKATRGRSAWRPWLAQAPW